MFSGIISFLFVSHVFSERKCFFFYFQGRANLSLNNKENLSNRLDTSEQLMVIYNLYLYNIIKNSICEVCEKVW